MTIQAQSADGTIHEFPDGTDGSVIDRVMKQYAVSSSQAQPTSLAGAAGLSLTDQVPSMLERGAGAAMNGLGVAPQTAQSLIDRANANDQDYQNRFVPDPSVPKSAADAVGNSTGIGDAASRLGNWALHGVAENAGPVAAGLASAPLVAGAAAAGSVPAAIGAAGMLDAEGLMNLGGVMQAKQAHGLDGSKATVGDAVNAAGQTALNALPVGGEGAGLLAKTGLHAASGFAKGTMQSLANNLGAAAQGGTNFGADPVLQIASDALDSGLIGGTMGAGMHLGGQAVAAPVVAANAGLTNYRAGSNMRAFNDETSDWNAAVQKATAAIQQQNPTAAPEDVRSQAYQAAAASGVTPPTFDTLSAKAQNGAAELATLQMYQGRLQAETVGMGRPDFQPEPSTVFKGVMRDIDSNLRQVAGGLVDAGMVTKDQVQPLMQAIAEAQRHNHNGAQDGSQFNYFDTFRDQLANLPIDPAIRNTLLMQLRVLDVASTNSLKQNSKGPLERNAGTILPALGAGAAALTGGLAPMEGALGGALFKGAGMAGLRQIDRIMGTQQPDLLRRADAIQDYADKNGIQPGTTPGDLMAIAQQMRDLGNQAPQGPAMAAQQQAMAQRNAMPVTSNPQGFANGIRPPDPNAQPIQSHTVPGRPLVANPRDALAARPVPAQAPAAAPVASLPGDAVQAIQASLAARAGRLGQEAQAAFPSDPGGGWSRSIAQTLGVPHTEVRRVIDEAAARGDLSPQLHGMLNQDQPIPRQVMSALTNHVADLRDRGMVSLRPDNPPLGNISVGGGSVQGQMRLASYQASIGQARDAAAGVRAVRPDLNPVVSRIEAASKTADKGALLDRHLATVADPAEQARQEALLRPLTNFGDKSVSARIDAGRRALDTH